MWGVWLIVNWGDRIVWARCLSSPRTSAHIIHLSAHIIQLICSHHPTDLFSGAYSCGSWKFPRETRRQDWSVKHCQPSAYIIFAKVPLSNASHITNPDLGWSPIDERIHKVMWQSYSYGKENICGHLKDPQFLLLCRVEICFLFFFPA